MPWFHRHNVIDEAIAKGDLDLALERLSERPRQRIENPRLVRRLTSALVDRANVAISSDNLLAAWKDLTTAAEVATTRDQDNISKRTNQLIELTIENADAQLLAGKTSHAVQLITLLSDRNILDWRADRIREVANFLHQAEDLAAEGKFDDAIQQLENATNLQPELDHVSAKIESHRQRHGNLDTLTAKLQSAALKCHWDEVNQLCLSILKLAPKHEIALAAKKHSVQRMKRRTSAGSRLTNVPERITDSNSFFQIDASNGNVAVSKETRTQPAVPNVVADTDSFLVWVDGVGGYLVCTDPVNLIGQAIEDSSVSIPLQADLRKRHARIELIAGQHLIQPMGDVKLDGEKKDAAFVLKNNQTLSLGAGVQLKYSQPHPLSKTSRLDFISRHRTQPWSDGVLLFSQSIIFGPNQKNHVFCSRWHQDVIFFKRKDQWFCRCKKKFQVDGQPQVNEAQIQFNSHITGDDFSLTLEPVFKPGSSPRES